MDRRTFVKRAGATGALLSGIPGLATARGIGRETRHRYEKTTPGDVRSQFASMYDDQVAARAVSLWQRYSKQVVSGEIREDTALDAFLEDLADVSPAVSADINTAQRSTPTQDIASENQRAIANGDLTPSSDSVSTLDNQGIWLIDGASVVVVSLDSVIRTTIRESIRLRPSVRRSASAMSRSGRGWRATSTSTPAAPTTS